MPEKFIIARPYALAIFTQACQERTLAFWSQMLTLGVNILHDPKMSQFIGNPRVTRDQLTELFIAVVGNAFSAAGHNFLRLLIMNDRLVVLPEIAELFNKHRAEFESQVTVICAYPIGADQESILARALEKRLGHQIKIKVQVDPEIIGGAIIHIGDVVIDGSLRAGLTQMAGELRH